MKHRKTYILRAGLVVNALFSFGCAVSMLLFTEQVGRIMGFRYDWVFQISAIGLIVFSFDLVHQALQSRMASWRALYASMADFMWVISSVAISIIFPDLFSDQGDKVLMTVAGIVLIFGIWQMLGIVFLHRTDKGLCRHCMQVSVNVAQKSMWKVIGQLSEIKKYSPSLEHSSIRQNKEPAVGVVRICIDKSGRQWSEECTNYQENQGFDVRFLCDDPKFPYPATKMIGGWLIESTGVNSSVITVWWELTPKPILLTAIIMPLLAFQADRSFPKVVARMAKAACEEETSVNEAAKSAVSRLLPSLC